MKEDSLDKGEIEDSDVENKLGVAQIWVPILNLLLTCITTLDYYLADSLILTANIKIVASASRGCEG